MNDDEYMGILGEIIGISLLWESMLSRTENRFSSLLDTGGTTKVLIRFQLDKMLSLTNV